MMMQAGGRVLAIRFFGAHETGTRWKIEAGDTEKINAGRAGIREGQAKPPCVKHSKPPASSSSTRTAVAPVYDCESPGKKGRTNKAIGQCCAINDVFCLTEIAGYANICAWNGSRAAVGNQQEQGGRAARARRLGRPPRWRP